MMPIISSKEDHGKFQLQEYNDRQLVNWMEDNLDDDFLDLGSFFPEVFPSSSSNNSTRKSVLETHGVQRLDSPTFCFSFPDGMETFNNSNLVSFKTSSSSSMLGLLERSSKNMYANGKHKAGFESLHDNNEVPVDNLGSNGVNIGTRSPIQAQDHVLTEQKRREKMRQLFITLSKIVPGLKKLDKATLIGDAIEHMKELKERVKILEEGITKKNNHIGSSSSSDALVVESSQNSSRLNLDIKARVTKNNVLIKICCKKQKSIVSKIEHHLELLHLRIVDIRIMPFGDSLVDISILAQMRDDFCLKPEDIVQQLMSL
ncbi:basic helix-loop-helix transcription factor [Lithospermum erythrorhizon]|uniref:Basic helix-loop-helix transcription factor n=1 Tax=Lithospermum erythrorhizon TaxID=34254 RepID=A0AAV3PDB3_LITER